MDVISRVLVYQSITHPIPRTMTPNLLKHASQKVINRTRPRDNINIYLSLLCLGSGVHMCEVVNYIRSSLMRPSERGRDKTHRQETVPCWWDGKPASPGYQGNSGCDIPVSLFTEVVAAPSTSWCLRPPWPVGQRKTTSARSLLRAPKLELNVLRYYHHCHTQSRSFNL
jgi:hypothetical protein